MLLLWLRKAIKKATLKSGERTFNLGKVTYKDNPKGFIINVNTDKHYFEFILPTLKKVEEQADKTVDKERTQESCYQRRKKRR